jgi:hypothetical protein
MQQKKFWQGTQFYFALLILIGSFWGMTEGTANAVIGAAVGLIGAVGTVRNFLKTASPQPFLPTLLSANGINYLTAVLVAISPALGDLVPPLKTLIEAIQAGNWGAIVSALVSLGTIIFYLVKKNKPAAAG